MADAWGGSWGTSWGASWGASAVPARADRGGDGFPRRSERKVQRPRRVRYLIYKEEEVEPVTARPPSMARAPQKAVASALDIMRAMGIEPPPEIVPQAVFVPAGLVVNPQDLARAWMALVERQMAMQAEADDEDDIELLMLAA
jgi:hypothetical protein